jgi:hypothetical protein
MIPLTYMLEADIGMGGLHIRDNPTFPEYPQRLVRQDEFSTLVFKGCSAAFEDMPFL